MRIEMNEAKSKINFNWGTGIVIACAVFITASVLTGITFMNQKVDLVTSNYYEKELRYQEQIDKINRTEPAKDKVDIKILNGTVQIFFDSPVNKSQPEGEINFYRPSDSSKDFIVPISLDEEGKQLISTGKMDKGFWKIQLSWKADEQNYYFEKSLFIN